MVEEGSIPRPAVPGSDGQQQQSGYTIPGVLHFIRHEFSRFEKERANWEVEKAELLTKIAFLQGERKGHENLMHDLVRRIKMLEFALKQERAKLYKLQHGSELVFSDMKPPAQENSPHPEAPSISNQRESRKILREYLREVGFPDSVLDARLTRIALYKSLVNGSNAVKGIDEPGQSPSRTSVSSSIMSKSDLMVRPGNELAGIPNGTDTEEHPGTAAGSRTQPSSKQQEEDEEEGDEEDEKEESLAAQTSALDKCFEFLDDEDSDEEKENGDSETLDPQIAKAILENLDKDPATDSFEDDLDETEDVTKEFEPYHKGSDMDGGSQSSDKLGEFDFNEVVGRYQPRRKQRGAARPTRAELQRMEQFTKQQLDEPALPSYSSSSSPSSSSMGMGMMRMPGGKRGRKMPPDIDSFLGPLSPNRLGSSGGGTKENSERPLGIDDLAFITITPEAVGSSESQATENVRRWDNKYTMRSHFDVVSSVVFHPTEPLLVTGSMDCTLKLWNLNNSQSRRTAIVDVEPMSTLRGHTGGVLCVAMSTDGDVCYSAGCDTDIRMWQIPVELADQYDTYDPEIHRGELRGHTDAVWGMVVHPISGLLASCSADGRCILWDPQLSSPQLKTFIPEEGLGCPTSLDFLLHKEQQHLAVSYNTAKTIVYDLETSQPVLNLDSATTYDGTPNTQINKVVCHPTLPIVVTAHEDKYIRFYDSNTGKVINSMTAHMDAVTGLAIDPHGLYLLSGSHDGSLRFWSMESKICIQEITAHRKHFDESICNVACHLTKPYFASCGADSVAKVFV